MEDFLTHGELVDVRRRRPARLRVHVADVVHVGAEAGMGFEPARHVTTAGVRPAIIAGAWQRDRALKTKPSVVSAPHSVRIEAPPRSCARKKPETGDF
jgi:hypothetical protein